MTRKYSSTSVATTLAAGINTTATSITVATGTSSALMGGVSLAPGNIDSFAIAIDVDTINEEIVWVTQVNSDTLTVVRAKAGTTAIAHTAGASIKHVFTGEDATFFTTGTATADAAIPKSTVTAKGDLLAASASATVSRLPIGTNDQALIADSTQTLGLKWGPVGDVTLTGTQTLTNKTLTSPKVNLGLNALASGVTAYSTVLNDNGSLITTSATTAVSVTITSGYPQGAQINVLQYGTGQAQFSGVAGVSISSNAAALPKTRVRYSAMTAINLGSDTWIVVGDIV